MSSNEYNLQMKLPDGGWATVEHKGKPMVYRSLLNARRGRDRLLRYYRDRSVLARIRVAEVFGDPVPASERFGGTIARGKRHGTRKRSYKGR